jgi:hypothetical protein
VNEAPTARPDAAPTGSRPDEGPLPRPLARATVATLIGVGLLVRILPLVQGSHRLLRQPSEDGYLMLTVARNIAVGLGMSTAGGTIPTNGVQPLATGLYALGFFAAGGDKTKGVAFVMAFSVIIAVLGGLAVYRLGRTLLATVEGGAQVAALAAAAWFASPIVIELSMNALESGTSLLVLAVASRFYLTHAADADRDLSFGQAAALGLLLGIAFWARNDAVFFAGAVAIARVAPALARSAAVFARRCLELAISAAVMAIVAAPWMISNLHRFGSIVPISGKAESAERVGANLDILPAKLAEFVTVVGAIPNPLEPRRPVQIACTLLVLAALVAAVAAARRGPRIVRAAVILGLAHAGLLAAYYGAFFGAGHFLSRYTSPVSIWAAFLSVAVGLKAVPWRGLRLAFPVALVLLAVVLDGRLYSKSDEHMHMQVVDWVDAHVPADAWVGAVQSGTLGFFHDRTINLDGKTNPDALRARFANRMREYIMGSKIAYIADWEGMASWISWLRPNFVLVVDDPKTNLAVLERVP